MTDIKPYVPRALGPGDPSVHLTPVVVDWAAHWLASAMARLSLGPAPRTLGAASGTELQWFASGEQVIVGLSARQVSAFASAILDRPIAVGSERPADRNLLERLCGQAIDDLCGRLRRAAGLPETKTHQPDRVAANDQPLQWWSLVLSEGRFRFNLGLSLLLIDQLRRQSMAMGPATPLAAIGKALENQSLSVGALLGAATIDLADSEQLAVDDVVVLDRETQDELLLTIGGIPIGRRCRIEQEAGRVMLVASSAKGS